MTVSSYQLNHPKAYIGYAVAREKANSKEHADELTEEYVTGGVDMARRGAENLRLVTNTAIPPDTIVTSQGRRIVESTPAYFECDTTNEVLEELDSIRGARSRFCEQYPEFTNYAPMIALQDLTFGYLVGQLQVIHRERIGSGQPYSLGTDELYEEIESADADFANALFKSDSDGYRSATTYAFKNIGWHLGVFQTKGTQVSELDDPNDLTWALEPQMLDYDHGKAALLEEQEVQASG